LAYPRSVVRELNSKKGKTIPASYSTATYKKNSKLTRSSIIYNLGVLYNVPKKINHLLLFTKYKIAAVWLHHPMHLYHLILLMFHVQ
jgi:hypothetical protein